MGAAAAAALKAESEREAAAGSVGGGPAADGLGRPLQIGLGAGVLPIGFRPGNNTLYFPAML